MLLRQFIFEHLDSTRANVHLREYEQLVAGNRRRGPRRSILSTSAYGVDSGELTFLRAQDSHEDQGRRPDAVPRQCRPGRERPMVRYLIELRKSKERNLWGYERAGL